MDVFAVEGLPEVRPGDDVGALIAEQVDLVRDALRDWDPDSLTEGPSVFAIELTPERPVETVDPAVDAEATREAARLPVAFVGVRGRVTVVGVRARRDASHDVRPRRLGGGRRHRCVPGGGRHHRFGGSR